MKTRIFVLSYFITLLISLSCNNLKDEDLNLRLNATINSTYSVFDCDTLYYLLMDVRLINKTDSTCTFLASECTTSFIFLANTNLLNFNANSCSANSEVPISIKPSQEFSIPILLSIKEKDCNVLKKFKLGMVLLHPHTFHQEFPSIILNMKKNKSNIIWSSDISLNIINNQQYKIENLN